MLHNVERIILREHNAEADHSSPPSKRAVWSEIHWTASVAISSKRSNRFFPELSSPKNPSLSISYQIEEVLHCFVPQGWSLDISSESIQGNPPCRLGDLWLLYLIRISSLKAFITPKVIANEGRKVLRQFFHPMDVRGE